MFGQTPKMRPPVKKLQIRPGCTYGDGSPDGKLNGDSHRERNSKILIVQQPVDDCPCVSVFLPINRMYLVINLDQIEISFTN